MCALVAGVQTCALPIFLMEEKDNVQAVFGISGFGFVGQGQNVGINFVRLKPWSERAGRSNSAAAIAARANAALKGIRAGQAIAFIPPAAVELGNANGFDLPLKDVAHLGHDRLTAARDHLLGLASTRSEEHTSDLQ